MLLHSICDKNMQSIAKICTIGYGLFYTGSLALLHYVDEIMTVYLSKLSVRRKYQDIYF